MPSQSRSEPFDAFVRRVAPEHAHLILERIGQSATPGVTERQRREEFLRRFDDLIAYAETTPFLGRERVLRTLRLVRRQRGLKGRLGRG